MPDLTQPQVIDYGNQRVESRKPLYGQGQGDYSGNTFSAPASEIPPEVTTQAPPTSFAGALSKVSDCYL